MALCLSCSSSLNRITPVCGGIEALMEGFSLRGEMLNVAACPLLRYISGTVVVVRGQRELIAKQD